MAPKANKNKKVNKIVNQNENKKKKIRRPNHKGNVGNINKVYQADEVLASVAGIKAGNRGQFVKAIWDYIKKNKLQKPGNGRVVIPDAKLAKLMGNQGKEVNAFTMMRFIERHLKKD